MSELVAHDRLQLVARELPQRPGGHRDDRAAAPLSGGERVDPRLVAQHEHLRDRDPRRDRHLLDDVDEAAFVDVLGAGVEPRRADGLHDGGRSATRELDHVMEAARRRRSEHAHRHEADELRVEDQPALPRREEREGDAHVEQPDQREERQAEPGQQEHRPEACRVLRGEEVWGRARHGGAGLRTRPGPLRARAPGSRRSTRVRTRATWRRGSPGTSRATCCSPSRRRCRPVARTRSGSPWRRAPP